MGTLAYRSAKLSEVQDVLTALFPSVEGGDRYMRAAQTNMVVLGGAVANADALDSVIEALALVHPARFFVVLHDDRAPSVRAEVAAQCHIIGTRDYVCSEVVRLHVPKAQLGLVPNVVKAHAIPGMVTELYLAVGVSDPEEVRLFLPQADRVIFDSEEMRSVRAVSELVGASDLRLLDLQWARLAGWREQIRGVFSRPLVTGAVHDIHAVEIVTGKTADGAPSTAALLLAGWVLERLDQTPVRRAGETIHCEPRGRAHHVPVQLTLKQQPGGDRGRIHEVGLGIPTSERFPRGVQVTLRRGDGAIEGTLELDSAHRMSFPLESEEVPSLIRRSFVIGESTAKYRSSLERGLEIEQL